MNLEYKNICYKIISSINFYKLNVCYKLIKIIIPLPQKAMCESSIQAIKCNNIFLDSSSPPISGLLIFSSTFEEIINFATCTEHEKEKYKKHNILDFSDSYIFPGIIDMNLHLNSNSEDPEWAKTSEITKLCIQGGVTTLIDNPFMNRYNGDFDEVLSLKERIANIKEEIYTDCGLFGYLGNHNYKMIEEIHNSRLVLGYKLHLSRTWQSELPFITKKALGQLFKKIGANPLLRNVLLAFHSVLASDWDMFMCSPLKKYSHTKRFTDEINIRNSTDFAGGLSEDLGFVSKEEDPNSNYLSDDELDDWMNSIEKKQNMTELERLEIQAKIICKSQEESSIAKMELFQYHSKDSPLIEAYESSSSSSVFNTDSCQESPSPFIPLKNGVPSIPIIQSFQYKKPTPLLVQKINNLNVEKENKASDDGRDSYEEIKTADLLLKNRDSLKIVSEPSKLLSRRMLTSTSLITGSPDQKYHSLNSIGSFEVIKLKTDQKTTKEKENIINHNYEMFLSNHALTWEIKGVRMILHKAKTCMFESNPLDQKPKLLFMNLSSNSLLFQIKNFKEVNKTSQNMEIFTEICTPYLYFHSSRIKEGQTQFKASPPIRIKRERDLFLEGIKQEGIIDVVSSYHFYVPWVYKDIDKGNFRKGFEGLNCAGLNLPVLWTQLFSKTQKSDSKNQAIKLILEHENLKVKALQIEVKTHNAIMRVMMEKLCENPAKILGLEARKGRIAKGLDADFLIWNPFKKLKITEKDLPLKDSKSFIFLNMKLYGEIKETYLRGGLVFRRNEKGNHLYVKKGEVLRREGLN